MTTSSTDNTLPPETPAARVRYGDKIVRCAPGETVLEGLLRAGAEIPYSCRNGTCMTCISRAVRGTVPAEAQKGIKDTLRGQDYFLSCICKPTEDLEIAPPEDADLFGRAAVTAVDHLSKNICRVRLTSATPLYYHAGQFLNLRRDDGLTRSYSLASVPSLEPYLEIHVKRLPGGQMSNWIYDDLQPGVSIDIQGPSGGCFYFPGNKAQPMLLIGNGSGLAPLIGIARDALKDGHTGPIHLYHGTQFSGGLYLDDTLRQMDADHGNFFYNACLSRGEDAECCHGRAEDIALADHTDLSDWRVFLCGYPPMVRDAQRRAFLAGAALADIYIDAFELRDLRTEPRE